MKINYFASPELKALAEHSKLLGWYSEADWETFVRTGVVFGHRLQSGEIVSSAYLSNFENQVGWLGAVIVNSRFQGKKLGRDLIQKAIAIAPDHDFVLAVVATERGKKMFEQGGFNEIGNTHKFVLRSPNVTSGVRSEGVSNVREFSSADLNSLSILDQQAVGYSRFKLLSERLKSAIATFVIDSEDEVSGFIIVSKEGSQFSIGPTVAGSAPDAVALVKHAVRATSEMGTDFKIDVPHWQSEFIREIGSAGFELERICPILTYKGVPLPRASDQYFSLIAQALG